MSKNSSEIFIRLDGANGATYFFNTATLAGYWKSLQFYRAVSFKGSIRKLALLGAYWIFKRKASLSGKDVSRIISDTLGMESIPDLPVNSSALISPTRDKAVINQHNGSFIKYAAKESYAGVVNELDVYRVLNHSNPNSFTVSSASEIFHSNGTIAFKMSECRPALIERDEPQVEQLVLPLTEFFTAGETKTVPWRNLFDTVKNDQFCDAELSELLPESPEGVIETGLCHRDFKVWNVKMYDKPHFFDFESAVKDGVPGEDLFNYVVDPLLNFNNMPRAVAELRLSGVWECFADYLDRLGISQENSSLIWRYYLAERVLFWRRHGNPELAGKFLELLKYGDALWTKCRTAQRLQTIKHLATLVTAALVVRIGYLWTHPMESRDGIHYINFVREWFWKGDDAIPDFTRVPPPLYCYTSRSLMYCGLSAESATLLVSMASGILLFIPLYFAGKIFWGRRGAFWCGILGTVFPPLVRFSCERLREGIYYFFVFSAFTFFLYAVKKIRPQINSAVCGAMCAFALYCRYEAFELFIMAPAGIAICSFFPGKSIKAALLNLLCFAGIAFLTLLVLNNLPGMPDILTIFWNRIYLQCLGTFINPV